MSLIVAHHYVVNSGLTSADGPIYANPMSWRSLFLLIFGAWGKTGINCFVLITGYFMCQSHITVRKFVKLVGELVFYNIVIYLCFLLSGYEAFSIKSFILSIFPITSIDQNFTACYLIFFLFIPFLNIFISAISEKQHIEIIALCAVTYILFGTVHRVAMNYVSWYMVLYFIASYIRLYPKAIFRDTRVWGSATAIFVLLSIGSVIVCAWIGSKVDKELAHFFVSDSNTFLAVATGVSSFLLFNNLRVKNSLIINAIAASTFGVLCIHANSDTMRQWLWKSVLDNVDMYSSRYLVVHAVGSVAAIFCICVIIDYCRISFLEQPFLKWVTSRGTDAQNP